MTLFVQSVYLASGLSLGYIFLLYRANPFRRLPTTTVTVSFVIGMVAVIPVILVRRFLPAESVSPAFVAYVSAGMIEESVKFALMALTLWRFGFPDIAEPMDLAIYFGILGVGFGIYEDFSYLFSGTYTIWKSGDIGRFHDLMRGLLMARAFPGHILFDGIAGFLIGRSRFLTGRRIRAELLLGGFLLAVLLHGTFNMIAAYGGTIPLITYICVLAGLFLYLRQNEIARSPFRAVIEYIKGRRKDWPYERPPIDYLFAEGFSWPARPRGGLFTFFPLVLSLVILYPFLVALVYLLERAVVAASAL